MTSRPVQKHSLSEPFSFRLSHALIARLKALATAERRTVSEYIRIKLEEMVETPKGKEH